MMQVVAGSFSRNAIALRAMRAIELHLPDAGLNSRKIAGKVGISLRYLQEIFKDTGESVNHYIRRRRLHHARQELTDPRFAAHSIAELSLRWGFADAGYFSRSFKAAYGVSPNLLRHGTGARRAG